MSNINKNFDNIYYLHETDDNSIIEYWKKGNVIAEIITSPSQKD